MSPRFLVAVSISDATEFFNWPGYTGDTAKETEGMAMVNQSQLVAVLSFLVNVLLIFGTNRLAETPLHPIRGILAAAIGGVYSGACLLPGFSFLGSTLWRLISLVTVGAFAFGIQKNALYPIAAFCLMSMAMGGVASGLENSSFWSALLAMGCICLLFYIGFVKRKDATAYVPVELHYDEKQCSLTALRDTGNTLKDPITGGSVLIVGSDVAKELTGLTGEQLRKPVEVMGQSPLPGLRLIPYRTVGQPAGMLLAMRIPKMRIGGWQGSGLVAFAPDTLSPDGKFQALTGGAL